MQHIEVKVNVVTVALFWLSAIALPTIYYHQLMAIDQGNSKNMAAYKTSRTSLCLGDILFGDLTILCNITTTGRD